MATTIPPPIINGLRLPYFDLELSASTPMTGPITSPDSGPAIHTSDVLLLVRPSCKRYGVQSESVRFGFTHWEAKCRIDIYKSSQCPM